MNRLRVALFLLTFLVAGSVPAYQPFFDQYPATLHAPEEPQLTDLDLDVLLLCGGWGEPVEAVDFEAMMLQDEHREALQRIHQALGGRIFSSSQDMPEFVHQLRRVWFEQKGFHHVICGEPGVERHFSTLVIRQRALRSFYPMADRKPHCHKNKRDYRDCVCSRL